MSGIRFSKKHAKQIASDLRYRLRVITDSVQVVDPEHGLSDFMEILPEFCGTSEQADAAEKCLTEMLANPKGKIVPL